MKKTQVSGLDKMVTPEKGQQALRQVSEQIQNDLMKVKEKALKRSQAMKNSSYGAFHWRLYHEFIVELISHTISLRQERQAEKTPNESMFSEVFRSVEGDKK